MLVHSTVLSKYTVHRRHSFKPATVSSAKTWLTLVSWCNGRSYQISCQLLEYQKMIMMIWIIWKTVKTSWTILHRGVLIYFHAFLISYHSNVNNSILNKQTMDRVEVNYVFESYACLEYIKLRRLYMWSLHIHPASAIVIILDSGRFYKDNENVLRYNRSITEFKLSLIHI